MGSKAMACRTEARKCNHLATGRLLELRSKVNATYKQMDCSFYSQPYMNLLRKINVYNSLSAGLFVLS